MVCSHVQRHHFDEEKLEWIPVPKKVIEKAPPKAAAVPKQGLPDIIVPAKAQSPADGPPVAKQALPNDPSKDRSPADGPPKQLENQKSQPSAETPPIAKQPNTSSSQQSTEPLKQSDPPKKPDSHRPEAQQAAENKIFTTAEKQERAKKDAELKRKMDEQRAIAKEEKRKATQKQADEKLAAIEAKKQTNANQVETRIGSVPSR